MERKENWRQDTPRMQAGALIGAAMGDINNVREGRAREPKEALERALKFLAEAASIVKNMPEGSW